MPFKRDSTGREHYVPRGSMLGTCPGCKKEKLFQRDGVCGECHEALNAVHSIREAQEAKLGEELLVVLPNRPTDMPYVPHECGSDEWGKHPINEPLMDLAYELGTPTDVGDKAPLLWPSKSWNGFYGGVRHSMKKENVERFKLLHEKIIAAINRAEAEGFKNGRNLLMGLASGSITNDEFNKTAARLGDK